MTTYALARMVAGRYTFLRGPFASALDVTPDVFGAKRLDSAEEAEAWIGSRCDAIREQLLSLGWKVVRLDIEITAADDDHGPQCSCPRLRCQGPARKLDPHRIDHWPPPRTVEAAEFGRGA